MLVEVHAQRQRPSIEIDQQSDAALDLRADRIRRKATMRIHNIYVDDAGENALARRRGQMGRGAEPVASSPPASSATGIIFRETGGEYYDPSLASRAAPAIYHQFRRRRDDHRQRWRKRSEYRRRRSHPGGRHPRARATFRSPSAARCGIRFSCRSSKGADDQLVAASDRPGVDNSALVLTPAVRRDGTDDRRQSIAHGKSVRPASRGRANAATSGVPMTARNPRGR